MTRSHGNFFSITRNIEIHNLKSHLEMICITNTCLIQSQQTCRPKLDAHNYRICLMLNCRRSKLNVLGSSPRQHKTHVRYTIAFLKHVSPKLTAQLLFVCLIEGAISHECYYIITYRFRIASLIAKCANINDHWKSLRLSNAHIQNAFSFSDVTSRHNSHHEKRQHQTKGPQNHGSLYHSRRFWSAIKSRSAECAADIWRLLSSTRMARVVSYGPSSGWCTIYIYIYSLPHV